MHVYLNGTYTTLDNASVSPIDRGFLFGDGIYEVIRAVRGNLFRAADHLKRMKEGVQTLSIGLDLDELNRFPEIGLELLRRNELTEREATVYLQVTRGAAWPRAHTFPDNPPAPTRFLYAAPFDPNIELHEKGVGAITAPDVRWSRCNLKTVNLLPNSMIRQRAVEAGANSAVMIRDGQITESPNANIFAVIDGVLHTYPLCSYILAGITRDLVLEFAESEEIPVRQIPVLQEQLNDVDELFFTGTTTDIQPVVELDGNPVGSGEPGPVTRTVQRAYRKALYG